jgi:SAM-dependent methyltransferase
MNRDIKVRDSGMSDEAAWEQFFDTMQILAELDFNDFQADVAEFGCGYGTFSVAAAQLTSGTVYALDSDAQMIKSTAARAVALGRTNVKPVERDFVGEGTGLPDTSVDYAMLFNILHAEDPVGLLREAWRVLRPSGKVAVIHWVDDAATSRGPGLSIRRRPVHCRTCIQCAGFELVFPEVALPPHHYGVVARKCASHV